jgi:hypothetical protein
MARFYVSTTNSRGNAVTACGQAHGQTTHTRGWDHGIRVISKRGLDDPEQDIFEVHATSGSHGRYQDRLLGTLVAGVWVPA